MNSPLYIIMQHNSQYHSPLHHIKYELQPVHPSYHKCMFHVSIARAARGSQHAHASSSRQRLSHIISLSSHPLFSSIHLTMHSPESYPQLRVRVRVRGAGRSSRGSGRAPTSVRVQSSLQESLRTELLCLRASAVRKRDRMLPLLAEANWVYKVRCWFLYSVSRR